MNLNSTNFLISRGYYLGDPVVFLTDNPMLSFLLFKETEISYLKARNTDFLLGNLEHLRYNYIVQTLKPVGNNVAEMWKQDCEVDFMSW